MDFSASYQGVFLGEAVRLLPQAPNLRGCQKCSHEGELYSDTEFYKVEII